MPTILLVDDQPEVLRIYSRGLQAAGYHVQVAETAEVAMQLVATEEPAAALVDLRMPYVNGMGILYRLREAHPHMPVAIVTGLQPLDEASLQEIARLGAKIHYKPVSLAEIRQIVDELVATK